MFEAIGDALSGEEYVSVSYTKPALHLLNPDILKPQEDKTGQRDLNDKHKASATDKVLTMATFLNPRFKATYTTEEKLEEVKSRVATVAVHP